MRRKELNLARRPFVNLRPVRRAAAALWVLGGILLLLDTRAYWGYFTGSDDREHELAALEAKVAEHERQIAGAKQALASFDLEKQNSQVAFLNRKIAERTFGWSNLFDQLGEILPADVRLVQLSPETLEPPKRGRKGSSEILPGERVRLRIVGIARTVEDELELMDRLFAHPAFDRPRLASDSQQENGQIRFNLSVVYLPERRFTLGRVVPTAVADAAPASAAPVPTGATAAPSAAPSAGGDRVAAFGPPPSAPPAGPLPGARAGAQGLERPAAPEAASGAGSREATPKASGSKRQRRQNQRPSKPTAATPQTRRPGSVSLPVAPAIPQTAPPAGGTGRPTGGGTSSGGSAGGGTSSGGTPTRPGTVPDDRRPTPRRPTASSTAELQ